MNNQPTNRISDRNDILTFIEASDIKKYCNVYNNIEDSQFKPIIETVQELYFMPMLGKTLYSEMMTEWVAAGKNPNNLPDGTTLPNSTNYKELYEEIYKPLIYYSYYHSLLNISVKVSEKGIFFANDENAENGGVTALQMLEKRAKDTAVNYMRKLEQYICDTFRNVRNEILQENRPEGTKRAFYIQSTTQQPNINTPFRTRF